MKKENYLYLGPNIKINLGRDETNRKTATIEKRSLIPLCTKKIFFLETGGTIFIRSNGWKEKFRIFEETKRIISDNTSPEAFVRIIETAKKLLSFSSLQGPKENMHKTEGLSEERIFEMTDVLFEKLFVK